MTNPQ
ncbi:rCG54754, partial [Rattus norvegicus]